MCGCTKTNGVYEHTPPPAPPDIPIAESELVLLDFCGEGPTVRYGPVTGTRYEFNSLRYVDVRDLRTRDYDNPGLLEMAGEDGKPEFVRAD